MSTGVIAGNWFTVVWSGQPVSQPFPHFSPDYLTQTLGCLNPQRTKGPVIISTRTGYFCRKWDELLKVNLHIKESSLFSKPPGRQHWCLDPETFHLLMNLNWFLFCKMYDAYAVSLGKWGLHKKESGKNGKRFVCFEKKNRA